MQEGYILDQATGTRVPFDPNRITPTLTWPLLDFIGNAPRDANGFRKWLVVVASRQSGKSSVTASALATKTSLTPGAYSVTMADTRERATTLFQSAEQVRSSLPIDVRAGTSATRELNQATYDQGNGQYSRYRCLSAQQGFAGIGRSIDNAHLCLHPDTSVRTPSGFRAIKDLKPGDVIEAGNGETTQVVRTWRTKRKAWHLRVHGHNVPVTCSGEHKWPTQRGKVATKDLLPTDTLRYPVKAIEGSRETWGPGYTATYEWGRVLGLAKHFPDAWHEYPRPFVEGLVHGYLTEEGASADKRLAYTFRDMVASLYGEWCAIQHVPADKDNPASYRVHSPADGPPTDIANGHARIPIEGITQTDESMEMVDIEVDHEDHTFLLDQAVTSNSELPFWPDLSGVWSVLYPAFVNRKNATIVAESTPAPMSEPGTEAFKNMATSARLGKGRWNFLFMPYFQSVLNERRWPPGQVPTREEQNFVSAFGPFAPMWGEALANWALDTGGAEDPLYATNVPWLTYRNLAFRREVLDNDEQLRRYPNLFDVFFPKDPVTCWVQPGATAIPSHALEAHLHRPQVPWKPQDGWLHIYEDPDPDATYVLGCDPAGYAAGDNAAFTIWKVWGGGEEEFVQVAEFATSYATPPQVAWYICKIAEKYNHAYVVVEKTGEGMGVTTLLDLAAGRGGTELLTMEGEKERVHLRNLHYHILKTGEQVPGVPAGAELNAKAMARSIDMLLKAGTRVRSQELLMQLISYRRDRSVREKENWRILNPLGQMPGRRAKHHWDRVSAFMLACYAVGFAPVRFKRRTPEDTLPVDPADEPRASDTFDGWAESQERLAKEKSKRDRRTRLRAKRKRRR